MAVIVLPSSDEQAAGPVSGRRDEKLRPHTTPRLRGVGKSTSKGLLLVVLAVFATSFALATASAKTEAECKKEFAAKKTAGETGGQSKASYVKACLAEKSAPEPAGAAEGSDDIGPHTRGLSASDVAKKSQNPIGDLYVFPLNNYAAFGVGPHGGTQDILEFQPVIPVHIGDDWNLINRAILPFVWTPDLSPAPNVPFGTAPLQFESFLTPRNPTNGWLWGIGPIVQAPTISNPRLGSNVWGAGPTGVLVYSGGPWVLGALVNNVWSFGGTHGPDGTRYSNLLIEPFVNYNFGEGWFLYTDPLITANWEASGTKWTVPIGAGVGKVMRIGKVPVKFEAGLFYNVVKPDGDGRWTLNTEIALIF